MTAKNALVFFVTAAPIVTLAACEQSNAPPAPSPPASATVPPSPEAIPLGDLPPGASGVVSRDYLVGAPLPEETNVVTTCASIASGGVSIPIAFLSNPVGDETGATQLTRMSGASSAARPRVSVMTAPLDAL